MAHKKGAGSSNNGRDSESKRLGVKLFGGQTAIAGNIIVRQRGTKFHPGTGVGLGKDHTIYATTDGTVTFRRKRDNRSYVSVLPLGGEVIEVKPKAKKTVVKEEAPVVEAAIEEVVEAAVEETPVVEDVVTESAPAEDVVEDVVDAVVEETPVVETVAEAEVAIEAPAEEAKPAKKPAAKKPAAKKSAKGDDLKKIEGVGPKIASILSEAGLDTFEAVANSTPDKIREILLEQGKRYASHNPDTWPEQARFAADGKWDELKTWQDALKGGRE